MLRLKEEKSDVIDICDLEDGQLAIYTSGPRSDLVGFLLERRGDSLYIMGNADRHDVYFEYKDKGFTLVKPLKTGDILEYVE